MSVRSNKPPQLPPMFPRPSSAGQPVRGPQQQPPKEPGKADGKSAPQTGGASAKGGAKAKGAPTGEAQGQEGVAAGALGAHGGGFDGLENSHEHPDRAALERLQGEGAHAPAHGQQTQEAPAPVAPELPQQQQQQQRKTTERESTPTERTSVGGRAKLRAVVMDRLLAGMKDAHDRLATFAKNPGRLGVVNLSLAIAESAFTYMFWQEPSTVPTRRAMLLNMLGLPQGSGDATIVREIMGEVHQAFVDFLASKPGTEAWQRFDEVLQRYEAMQVQPVVPGHDTGPMLAELQRLKLPHELSFTRSLLLHPLMLGVALSPEEGSETQVMVAGLSVADLGALVAHMRRLNPRLTNKLVRQLLYVATTDKKRGTRKALGDPALKDVQELARQLLRLQVTHHLIV